MIPQQGQLQISAQRIAANVALFRSKLKASQTMGATIKADAYGHGVSLMAPLLAKAGVSWAIVYGLHEAEAVLRAEPSFDVLVLAPIVASKTALNIPEEELNHIASGKIRVNITDLDTARALMIKMAGRGEARVHVQIDTGLSRVGVLPKDAGGFLDALKQLPNIKVEGVFAHFSHGDEPGHPTIRQQQSGLLTVARKLRETQPDLLAHVQNSGGAWNTDSDELNMVRLGIALYGLQPNIDAPIPGLQPIAKVVAPILSIYDRPAGVGVGYGHTFVTKRKTRLAIVPVGYADGYPRAMSNKGVVQVGPNKAQAPVIGRVSMDQIILDVTDIDAHLGDDVIVMSDDPAAPNSMDHIAQTTGTIGYEIATGLGARLKRIVVE